MVDILGFDSLARELGLTDLDQSEPSTDKVS
jgi:hypothetical protein